MDTKAYRKIRNIRKTPTICVFRDRVNNIHVNSDGWEYSEFGDDTENRRKQQHTVRVQIIILDGVYTTLLQYRIGRARAWRMCVCMLPPQNAYSPSRRNDVYVYVCVCDEIITIRKRVFVYVCICSRETGKSQTILRWYDQYYFV